MTEVLHAFFDIYREMGRKRRGRVQEPPEDILRIGEELFGLDRGGIEALGILIGMCPLFEREGESFEDDLLAKLGMMLTYPGVAGAVGEMAALSEPILQDLALRVAAADHNGDKAGAFFALARVEELRGNVLGAEAMVEEALGSDPDFPPAVLEAAIFSSERGNARRALELFHRAGGAQDAGAMALLRAFARPPSGGTARNSPCPCGSGKKHKLCCLKAGHPLERRASWLFLKIASWAVLTSGPTVMADLAREMFEGDPEDVLLEAASRDSTILDVAVFDQGLLDEYLDTRGVLLPADERELARSWLKTRRSAYEVVSVTSRQGCRLRDLLTGDEIDVEDPDGWDFYQPPDILFARVVPAGLASNFFASPTVVPRPQRHSLVAMLKEDDSWDGIVKWRLASRQLPHLINMEGEEAPPPEVLEALNAHMADYEERWLDMSIPALDGATPREAVDDPRLRNELEALLDDFDWSARRHAGPDRGMDAPRLRKLLGI